MKRGIIYEKTNDYIRGRWTNIILVLAGIWGINFVVGLLVGGSSTALTVTETISNVQDGVNDSEISMNIINSIIQGARRDWLREIIQGTVSSILSAGFMMALLESFKKDETISFEAVFENVRAYTIQIVVASLIIGVVQTVVNLIPLIGAIISIILSYMFAYVFFIIKEYKQEDVVNSIKTSVEMTKGHKINLFMIDLYYLFRPLLALILIPIGGFIIQDQFAIGFLLMLGGLIAGVVLGIRFIPYVNVARTIYYAETNPFEEVSSTNDYSDIIDHDRNRDNDFDE